MTWWLILLSCISLISARSPAGQNVIFIQIDGYGDNLLNRSNNDGNKLFGIRQMIDNGAQAEYLKSTFPTQGWPNWMSLATGLYVENHGFTAEYMWDSRTGNTFERLNGPNDTEDNWWMDLPAPFWYTAGKANVDIHCYWFAHCHRPHYDMVVQVPSKRVIDVANPSQTDKMAEVFPEIINRITKYQAYKQQMFLLRYAGLDQAQKQYGQGSDEAEAALDRVDLWLHELQNDLEANNLFESTNLIVMSDHGLAPLEEEEQFYLEECLSDYSKVKKVVNSHSMLMVFTEPEDEGNIHFELRVCDQWAPMGDYEDTDTPMVKVYKMSEIPEDLHWKNSRYLSGVVLVTKPGSSIITRELPSVPASSDASREVKMTSGWDPELPEMRGIFVARGPAFKVQEKHGPLGVVDIYQCLLNIVGLDPAHSHNGTWDNVGNLMTDGWEERTPAERSSSSNFLTLLPPLLTFVIAGDF